MKLLGFYRSRKYFMRLLLSVTLLVSVFLALFCTLLYTFSKNNAMELQQEATRKVLKQVNYNIDNLYASVINLTVTAFTDRDISVLMQSEDMDIFEMYNRLNKFDYIANSNLFVDSVILHNAHNGCYYISPQTTPVHCNNDLGSNVLEEYLKTHKEVPNLKLVPNTVTVDNVRYSLLSMFKQEQGSTLMLNIKPQWLFDNVSAINDLADRMLGEIMILDENDADISPDGAGDEGAARMKEEIVSSIAAQGGTEGHFVIGGGKNKKLVMFITSNATGWKLVGVQSYKVVFGNLDRIGAYSLFLLGCFILLSLVASTLISMQLYKPIGSLLRAIRSVPDSHAATAGSRDELASISNFNQQILAKLVRLESGQKATEQTWTEPSWPSRSSSKGLSSSCRTALTASV